MQSARKIASALFLLGWFCYFSCDAWAVHFSPDEMMNIDNFYWTPGPWRLFYSQFLIWRGYYRPMGGLFYLPLYALSGLRPAPYHVALSLLLLANVYLVYRLARLLGAGELAAGLAALAVCYHAGLSNLYYNTAFIYDALCGFFYLAALVYYGSIRSGGRLLNIRQTLVFLALLVGALNSKEMALTLPAALLAYEFVYRAAPGRKIIAWLRGAGWLPLLAGLLAAANLYGKVFGVDALTGMEGYQPVFTWKRFVDYQKIFLGDAAFLPCTSHQLLAFWALASYLAWRPGARPVLRFCWLFLVLSPLPIEFLPGKSQACLYLPTIGLAIFVVVVLVDLGRSLGAVLAREPLFRLAGRPAVTAALMAAAIFFWGMENRRRKQETAKPVMAALGAQTWQVIEQFRALNPHVSPHSHVVFLNDPFTEWDMLFIADLWFRDRTVTVHLQRLTPLPADQLAQIGAQFDYRDGKLLRVR